MDFNIIIPTLLEWWPLFFFAAILWSLGQQIKKIIPDHTKSIFWKYYWATLPIHPVMAGLIFGSFSFAPLPSNIKSLGGISGILFYGFSGFLAVYARDLFQTFIKYKNP
jgi:hypothetical protein